MSRFPTMLFCLAVGLGACGDDSRPIAGPLSPSESCAVLGATKELQRAICAADAAGVSDALSSMLSDFQPALSQGAGALSSEDEISRILEFRRLQFSILYRIFNKDQTVGRDLPWPSITSPDFRTVLAGHLAGSVRNRLTPYSLKEFGDYALQRLQQEAPTPGARTLVLLGTAEVPDLVAILRPYLFDAPDYRLWAAIGLAQSCTQGAADALEEARRLSLSSDESWWMQLQGALDQHQSVQRDWCRNDEVLPANSTVRE